MYDDTASEQAMALSCRARLPVRAPGAKDRDFKVTVEGFDEARTQELAMK